MSCKVCNGYDYGSKTGMCERCEDLASIIETGQPVNKPHFGRPAETTIEKLQAMAPELKRNTSERGVL